MSVEEILGQKLFFLPGHDRIAESKIIKAEYGIAQFLIRHGYGPGGKKLLGTIDTR